MSEKNILGIDYGNTRIGLAIAASSQKIGHPLKMLLNRNEEQMFSSLISLISFEQVETIVIGMPLGTQGQKTQMSVIIEKFVEKLQTQLQEQNIQAKIIPWNETLTSYQAYENLLEKGISHQKIKKIVDMEAACILLQEYLDNKEQI